MKRLAMLVVGVVALVGVGFVSRTQSATYYSWVGQYKVVGGDTLCSCPTAASPACNCLAGWQYQNACTFLPQLPSYVGSDVDYFYFNCAQRGDTFDLTQSGSAHAEFSKSYYGCDE